MTSTANPSSMPGSSAVGAGGGGWPSGVTARAAAHSGGDVVPAEEGGAILRREASTLGWRRQRGLGAYAAAWSENRRTHPLAAENASYEKITTISRAGPRQATCSPILGHR